MDQDTRREKLIKLANTMCNGELRTDPGTAEYQVLDYLLTDDELIAEINATAEKLGVPKPSEL